MNTQFGGIIRDARKAKGLNLKQAAEEIGELSQSYLCKLERGKETNPSWGAVVRICRNLGIPIVKLYAVSISDNGKGSLE